MFAMAASSVLFVFSDTLAKLAAQHWSVAQLLAVRSVFAVAFILTMIFAMGDGPKLRSLTQPFLLARSVLEACLALIFVSALALMPLADLTSILMLAPLVITAVASLFLNEQVGWRRWSAILVGFLGLLLVVQPGGAAANAPNYLFGAMLALVAVLLLAARDIMTRQVAPEIPSTVIALGTTCATFCGALLLSSFEPWKPFVWPPLFQVMMAALTVTLGNLLLVVSCRGVDLSAVAPFRYSSVLWAILLGYLALGELPNWLSFVGMAVIVASGVYLMHRERVRARDAAAAARP